MADEQSLWLFTHHAPIDRTHTRSTIMQSEMDPAASLSRISDIAVVTQNTQDGEYFYL
jgi:hypothetical protein